MNYDDLLDELFWELQPVKEGRAKSIRDPAMEKLLMKAYDVGHADGFHEGITVTTVTYD